MINQLHGIVDAQTLAETIVEIGIHHLAAGVSAGRLALVTVEATPKAEQAR